jgi:hypothetical protein
LSESEHIECTSQFLLKSSQKEKKEEKNTLSHNSIQNSGAREVFGRNLAELQHPSLSPPMSSATAEGVVSDLQKQFLALKKTCSSVSAKVAKGFAELSLAHARLEKTKLRELEKVLEQAL